MKKMKIINEEEKKLENLKFDWLYLSYYHNQFHLWFYYRKLVYFSWKEYPVSNVYVIRDCKYTTAGN